MKINQNMLDAMKEATRALRDEGPVNATRLIQRALQKMLPPKDGASGVPPHHFKENPQAMRDINPRPKAAASQPAARAKAAEATATEATASVAAQADAMSDFLPKLFGGLHIPSPFDESWGQVGSLPQAPLPHEQPAANDAAENDGAGQVRGGRFISASYSNRAGSRNYKLFIPSEYHGQPLPLVVMLHGCTQDPDDFALGTGMNIIAEDQPCFVAYPAQSQAANGSKCWNWFNAIDQQRDQGEPSIIAGITREIITEYTIDERQVFVAGMSAGGAMSVIMGTTYPDLYAAVGIHSGLPYAAAKDLPSALFAMKGRGHSAGKAERLLQQIPVIVFHGDQDNTVSPRNGDQIIEEYVESAADAALKIRTEVENGRAGQGRTYTRTVHKAGDGRAVAEQWLVHGAGHTWSGGDRRGSYTDSTGPDASREMMRFFATHPQQAGSA
ncbi:alpha/beta hydrolase family esterase [Undibacterium sp. TJN25]|uniref:extracellular catalytic domain type 1 short-chain-length polyhydroxyalkanoate depolymerase n=1 Tax=Undibacterium sp. TJN25 TaxID=3413056 RepID=UPI003BF30CD9